MEQRERLARYLFAQTAEWRWLASSEDARWDEWVERNQLEWLEQADGLLAFLADPAEQLPDAAR